MKIRSILILVVLSTVLHNCKKTDTNSPPPPPVDDDPAGVELPATVFGLISSFPPLGGAAPQNLVIYNKNASGTWDKITKPNMGGRDNVYYKGVIYSPVNLYMSGGVISQSFYAISATTGTVLWSKTNYQGLYVYPSIRNDTMFVAYNNSSYTSICAFDAITGILFWETPVSLGLGIHGIKLDQHNLFIQYAVSPDKEGLASFNINNRTVNWKFTLDNLPPEGMPPFQLSETQIFVQANRTLKSFDKNTGLLVWSKPDVDYFPRYASNMVYATCGQGANYGLYAFNALTGAEVWKWIVGYKFTSWIGVSENRVVFLVPAPAGYLACFNSLTGTELWRTSTDYGTSGPVEILGNRVLTRPYSNKPDLRFYHLGSGIKKDSIIFNENHNLGLTVIGNKGSQVKLDY